MSIDFSGGYGARDSGFGGITGQFSNGSDVPARGGIGYSSLTNMLQGNQSQGVANGRGGMAWTGGAGGGGSYGASYGGGGGWGYDPKQVNALVDRQMAENQKALDVNNSRWAQGNSYLQAAQQGYFNDPTTQGANALAQRLLANPDVLSQGVQNQIQGNAANSIAAQGAAQQRQLAGVMANNGQTDASSMAAMINQQQRQGAGQLSSVQSNLDIQAALQNRQSEQAALAAGQGMAQQNYNVNQNMANGYFNNVLYQKPFDLSPYLLGMQKQGGGGFAGGGGGNFTPYSGGQPAAGGGIQAINAMRAGGGMQHRSDYTSSGFTSGGPDAYANAGGGGPAGAGNFGMQGGQAQNLYANYMQDNGSGNGLYSGYGGGGSFSNPNGGYYGNAYAGGGSYDA